MLTTDPEYVAYKYADSEKFASASKTHQRYTVGEREFQATELAHLQVERGQVCSTSAAGTTDSSGCSHRLASAWWVSTASATLGDRGDQ
jgi:hypothetical protein